MEVRLTQEGIDLFQDMRRHPGTAFEPMGDAAAFRELLAAGIIEKHPFAEGCYLLSDAGRGMVEIVIGE
jgi:hypothetical protein